MTTIELPRIAECGSEVVNQNRSVFTLVQQANARPGTWLAQFAECGIVRLVHQTAGYVIAGSCMRLQDTDRWCVRWTHGSQGTIHGQSFLAETDARAHLATVLARD